MHFSVERGSGDKVHGLFPAVTANLTGLAHQKLVSKGMPPNTAKEGRNISTAL